MLSWDFSRLQLALKSHLSKAKWFGGSPPSTRSPFLLRPALTSHQGRQRGGGCCFPSLHLLLVPCAPALARSHPGCPCGRRRTARWARKAPPRPLGDRARSRAASRSPSVPRPRCPLRPGRWPIEVDREWGRDPFLPPGHRQGQKRGCGLPLQLPGCQLRRPDGAAQPSPLKKPAGW